MRAVVVVLPASMCAMIPILRMWSSVNLRGMRFCFLELAPLTERGHEKGPRGPVHDAHVGCGQLSIRSASPFVWVLRARERARMNAPPPEGSYEYSRGHPAPGAASGASARDLNRSVY